MAHRVIQFATGNVGTLALRAIIEHPDLELVGLWVHSPDKAGRDAGEEPLEVLASGFANAHEEFPRRNCAALEAQVFLDGQPEPLGKRRGTLRAEVFAAQLFEPPRQGLFGAIRGH